MHTLYHGNNLKIPRDYIKDESVDLVYLDPPFNSNRNYNVLFRNESGSDSESQITAFEDPWPWNPAAELAFSELINEPDQVGRMIESFRQFIGNNQMMAYLVMMAIHPKELHRVQTPFHYFRRCCKKWRNGIFSFEIPDVFLNFAALQNEGNFRKLKKIKLNKTGETK